MKEPYQLLYHDLLKDIERCMELPNCEKDNAESCFWIAYNYWEKLKRLRKNYVFKTEAEEIEFFKVVKPGFTSYMEYFIILSEALLCVPAEKEDAIIYWTGEANRFERFCNRNQSFVRYYENDSTEEDPLYFLRQAATDLKYVPSAPVYDVDAEFCTPHDHQVRGYLAYKRYYDFVKKRLEALGKEIINH